jgi:PAS domain S-box-containing protein
MLSAAPDRKPGRVFSHAGHPIFVLDPDRNAVRYANGCACSVLGYGVDELLARSISAVFLAERGALEAFLEAIVKQGEGWTTTLGLRAKSGALLPAELLAFRFRTGGQRYVLVLADTRGPGRGPPV